MTTMCLLLLLHACLILLSTAAASTAAAAQELLKQSDVRSVANAAADYGVDCSWPIHTTDFKCPENLLLGKNRRQLYEDFMNKCRQYHGEKQGDSCDQQENDRLAMSLSQPAGMLNYTTTGYAKMRAPDNVMEMLIRFWNENKDKKVEETWNTGNIYANYFDSPTYMVNVEDTGMQGSGNELKQAVWDAVSPAIAEWTGGQQLQPTSMYGIREYTTGAILSPHVDRIPLVSSCIINVAQDVDEDWPLEVYDRQGKAVNITMEPGDMVLYESGTLVHGRPFPLQGRFFANIFIHFEPMALPRLNNDEDDTDNPNRQDNVVDGFVYPPYLNPDSQTAASWRAENPQGWNQPPIHPSTTATVSRQRQQEQEPQKDGQEALDAHRAAALGNMDQLHHLAQNNRPMLHARDANGWLPVTEAVRAGHVQAVHFLLQEGADKNARYGVHQDGGSLLNLALDFFSVDAVMVKYLLSIGARNIEPEYDEHTLEAQYRRPVRYHRR